MAKGSAQKLSKDRIDIRTTATHKRTIQRAADLHGTDLSKFMLSSALEKARQVLDEHEKVSLSERDRDTFFAAILDPSAPNAALAQAAKRYKKLYD